MTPFVQDALVILRTIGISPYNLEKFKIALSVFIIGGFYVPLALALVFNWKGKTSIQDIADLAIISQANFKYFMLLIRHQQFLELLNDLNLFWPNNKYGSVTERNIDNMYGVVKQFVRIYIILSTVTVLSYVLRMFIKEDRTFVVSCYLFGVDTGETPVYEFIFSIHAAYSALGLTFQIGYDLLFLDFILQTVCQLRLIKSGFASIDFDIVGYEKENSPVRKFQEIGRHHCKVLEFTSKANKLYSVALLNQFLTSTFIVCGALLILIADGFKSSTEQIVINILYLTNFMGQMFLYCFAGSHIVDESESVAETVYNLKWWLKTQPRLRRRIALTIQRAHKPAKLEAGGVFEMNLHSYTDIVKTGMSFFTLVRTLYSKEDGPK